MLFKIVKFIVFLNLAICVVASVLYISAPDDVIQQNKNKNITSPEINSVYKIQKLEDLE
jgi:hypothetical protein